MPDQTDLATAMLGAAEHYAEAWTPFESAAPAKHVAIVACMDARLEPEALFGLDNGDAHVIRNAGGAVTDDVIRSLAISQRKLGTREVFLVHHTGCGMATFTDDELRAELLADTGLAPAWPAETFGDVDEAVRQAMRRVRRSPFLPELDAVRGFVFQVEDGGLHEVLDED